MTDQPRALISVGSLVAWAEGKRTYRGAVSTYRVVGERQLLTVTLDDASIAFVCSSRVVVDGQPRDEVEQTTTAANAVAIATAVLEGRAMRLPLNQQLRVLSLAVLARSAKS